METLILHPNSTAQWHALVNEAEKQSTISLGEDLESYLVFLLMRFMSKSDMASSVLAMDFLRACETEGSLRSDLLQDIGDKCLLFSGLFPGRAKRRRVHISYFVNLGQNAYYSLANLDKREGEAKLHNSLSVKFVPLMDVLLAMRQSHKDLLPLEAVELWQETRSTQALSTMKRYTGGVVVLGQQEGEVRH
ncbi:hypothetical protein BH10PSE19_BH10PSE19_10290 [soil metagenome]